MRRGLRGLLGSLKIVARSPLWQIVAVFAGFLLCLLLSASGAGSTPMPRAKSATYDAARGRFLFLRDCAHCHGRSGDGESPVRRTLHPKPFDLTKFELSQEYILTILHEGIPGTDMPAWHDSPEADLRTVSEYTARLSRPDSLSSIEEYAPGDALHEAGRRIYLMHCARCHGASGQGNGKDAKRYRPAPASFLGMRPSFAAAREIIERGVPGTAMASWPLLTPPEIQAVTYYVRSLYAGKQTESARADGATQ